MEIQFDIASLLEAYRSHGLTPVEVAREALRRIAAYTDPAVWIARVPEAEVLARAEALMRERGADSLPLYGIPFAVKDNIDCAGIPTTAGCREFAYAPIRHAAVVERLLAAGAIVLGKTNLDQFATGLVGTRSPYGAPRCVFDSAYVSGGSSSGSAVAVAAGLVCFALGTDTAGSGRVPAAYNNIVGLKPTRGLIGTTGVVPACRSLDCVSIFAASVGDADRVLGVAQGFDGEDPYSRVQAPRHFATEKFRFGVLAESDREFFGESNNARLYEAAISRLSALGGERVDIDFAPFRAAGALLYEGAWTAERLASIKCFMESHESAMDPSVRQIISGARRLSAVDGFEGQYRLAAAARDALLQWARMDVLVLPTAPIQDRVADVNADPIARNARLGLYTNFVNLLDCCAIAVPAGFRADGLGFGVTLVAPAFSDGSLAVLAERLHREGGFGLGAAHDAAIPKSRFTHRAKDEYLIDLFVLGAHMTGMPLNHELKKLGAIFRRRAWTVPGYRLFALPHASPAKPGLVRAQGSEGMEIEGEVWAVPAAAFGPFVAQIPAPLGIGKVALNEGGAVSGFLCEAYAVAGALDVSKFGSWRRYVESLG